VDEERENDRVACPNDLCTGALDREGRCGTCEMVFAQYARREDVTEAAASVAEEASDPAAMPEARAIRADGEEPATEASQEVEGAASDETEASDEVERVCCPDDLCTGVIGADGRCGTCGRSEAQAPEEQ
jgi:hypothetical protein